MSDADPTVAALARALERSQRRVGELDTLVRRLSADVARLARSHPATGEAGVSGSGPGGWLASTDPEEGEAGLRNLIGWVEAVYLRYPDAELPSCWLWHPTVVEELWWLQGAHSVAFDDEQGSWQRIGDWHDRFRPGVAKRLRAAVGGCELALHTAGTGLHDNPVVPLADAATDISRAWTTNRTLPEPNGHQLVTAERHDRNQYRKGNR
ncbi:hypothetical protein [Pseudonocardia sp. WMMC193]|uniref:hypothetical protein n=1 Tax=Pseudonocardia sp. WMMC193 TaxID=2911965 RepID=UPI001F248495|nr:hypothetical protein [Pseudonocardia sp. WMMC193]MCF7550905.1 hypothetical protein [Pseudonocardia sp. WMMC193]